MNLLACPIDIALSYRLVDVDLAHLPHICTRTHARTHAHTLILLVSVACVMRMQTPVYKPTLVCMHKLEQYQRYVRVSIRLHVHIM